MMETQTTILLFFALCGVGILMSLVTAAPRQGSVLAWLGCLAASTLVLAGANVLLAGKLFDRALWTVPGLATTLTLKMDRLSAVFVFITGLVLFPASIFAGAELNAQPERQNGRVFTVLLLGLYASIGLIFTAGDAVLFLLGWEVTSVLCYLLIVCGRQRENSHADAGYLLLAMGEAGTLAAALGFLLMAVGAGSLDFGAIKAAAPGLSAGVQWAVFLLSFFGFGVKAGLVPVNFWLPRAYVAAPRPFVPVLAGATLNLGLYGILRVNADLMPAAGMGPGPYTFRVTDIFGHVLIDSAIAQVENGDVEGRNQFPACAQ